MPPKAKKGKKVRYSRWLVTVNPLKPKLGSYPGGERGLRTKLEACARLLRPPMLKEFVYIASKDKTETYARDVKQTTLDHAVETGHTNKVGLHLHGLLSIQHTTNLRLSYPKYRAACEKILGHKCHFDAKIARGGESLADIRAYIHKGRQRPQPAPVVDGDE